jgi:hypothetical protein
MAVSNPIWLERTKMAAPLYGVARDRRHVGRTDFHVVWLSAATFDMDLRSTDPSFKILFFRETLVIDISLINKNRYRLRSRLLPRFF